MAEAFNELALPDAKAERYAALAEEIAAVLDGEPVRLASTAKVEWRPKVARILAPPSEPAA